MAIEIAYIDIINFSFSVLLFFSAKKCFDIFFITGADIFIEACYDLEDWAISVALLLYFLSLFHFIIKYNQCFNFSLSKIKFIQEKIQDWWNVIYIFFMVLTWIYALIVVINHPYVYSCFSGLVITSVLFLVYSVVGVIIHAFNLKQFTELEFTTI